jgi:nitrite reductase/ring-hydroxylating ferredoxin subunit
MFKRKTVWYQIFVSKEAAYKNIDIGDLYPVEIAGKKIFISRTETGFVAYADKCPHQGVKLSQAKCAKNHEITCPWHHYRFDLQTGKAVGSHAYFLQSYPIELNDDGLKLGIEKLF